MMNKYAVKVKVTVVAQCRRCGSIAVDDGVSVKMAPSYAWLQRHSVFVMPGPLMYCRICDACVQGWRTDYCSCGSGKKYYKCGCGAKTPVYFIGGELPRYML